MGGIAIKPDNTISGQVLETLNNYPELLRQIPPVLCCTCQVDAVSHQLVMEALLSNGETAVEFLESLGVILE
jgi:hypothetical protein